jgi:hypothetical protein
MTITPAERSDLAGTAENDRWPGPPGFLAAYPGYRGTALCDRLRATEYSYLDAGGHTYLDYAGAGLPAQAQLAAHAERISGPMARIYGPAGTRDRGGTVAFNLLDPVGHVIDERAVARAAAAAGISIRTGCFCNPGASEAASQLTRRALRTAARARPQTMDQYVGLLGLPSGGALRASVGLASTVGDVERFLAFVEMTYQDRVAGAGGLPSRRGC